jgi:hypothetical protein
LFEQKENENWKLGQIIDQYNQRSYVVQNEDGAKYRPKLPLTYVTNHHLEVLLLKNL